MDHKQWLNNEYSQWIKALQESTVHNFKEHPMVQRMLSEDVNPQLFPSVMHLQHILLPIDNIGRETLKPVSGACLRMARYAKRVLSEVQAIQEATGEFTRILEIGGGVGQFYAVLKALGYEGGYEIMDLPEVKAFQRLYLDEVEKRTGMYLPLDPHIKPNYLVSFYALGEFDDEQKGLYVEQIKNIPHGLVLWNPHSGASEEIPFMCEVYDETPRTNELVNVKMLTW